jgi:hypothetical protein
MPFETRILQYSLIDRFNVKDHETTRPYDQLLGLQYVDNPIMVLTGVRELRNL